MGETHLVAVNGTRINCAVEQADPSLPWLVFGNSLMTDLTIWDAQVAALRDRFRILRYDQRGHGNSHLPDRPLRLNDFGADLLGLLDHFTIERATYVGLSMGVPTGLDALSRDPRRFQRLVFVDGQAQTAPGGAEAWQERIDFAEANGMDSLAETTTKRWLTPEAQSDDRGPRLTRMIAATPLTGFVHCARALQDYRYAHVLGTIDCPVLIIAGACDGAMPDGMQRAFGAIPGSRMVVIEAAGHVPNFERPGAFTSALTEFLDTTGTERCTRQAAS